MLKKLILIGFLSSLLYAFDIKPVDLTAEGIEKANEPKPLFTSLPNGRRVYNDIGIIIKDSPNVIKDTQRVVTPIGEVPKIEKNSVPQIEDAKQKELKAEQIKSVFSDINKASEKGVSEAITVEGSAVKISTDTQKKEAVNLEK